MKAMALVLLAAALASEEPRARKLGDDPAPPPAVDTEPARPLPRTLAVCRDDATRRCWTAPREGDCAPDGRPYRLIVDAPADVADALAGCREQPPR
jgi:hypothetical protein